MKVVVDGIRVRWGLREDRPRIAALLELNGLPRWIAFEERFIVAERDGKVLAALRYRTEKKQLVLGLLVVDPWAAGRDLAVTLYAGVGELARAMRVRKIFARPIRHGNWHADYPHEAGYRRVMGGWHLGTTRRLDRRKELPAGGWVMHYVRGW